MPRYQPDFSERPGTVTAIRGIILQSDGKSPVGRMFIRPFEAMDRLVAGMLLRPGAPKLAMHAGIRVEIDGRHDYVVEQLVGSLYLTFKNGLNWTPYHSFANRDRGGWDLTIPATLFRSVDDAAAAQAAGRLNAIVGHPFVGEDCTAFVERAFDGRRLFADSPLMRLLGIGVRIGDPALPLLRPDTALDEGSERLLQLDQLRRLPDALADAQSRNVQMWLHRLLPAAVVGVAVGAIAYSSGSRRSTPFSSTARRFLRYPAQALAAPTYISSQSPPAPKP
jgi:hypothetical protein